MSEIKRKLHQPFAVMLAVYALFLAVALFCDSPVDIYVGLKRIITSRSVLLTDYIYVGGLGAALVNAALVGSFSLLMLWRLGAKPNGYAIMSLWLTVGFAFFGKNLFNMLPITFGVFVHSKLKKEPFVNYSMVALLSATLSPVVSGVAFSGFFSPPAGLLAGIALGFLVGIIFPVVSAATLRVHEGYALYNMGLAGGLIAMFLMSAFESIGLKMTSELHWSYGNNTLLAALLYAIFAGLAAAGLAGKGFLARLKAYPALLKHSGRAVTDYYALYGRTAYLNMGISGAFATTAMLMMGCVLNGSTLGGIFTIVGFSAFGKHIRNIIPPMLGAVIATHLNRWNPMMSSNTVAILFASGLAPIAGQFGPLWGVLAGFIHVGATLYVGAVNGGFNLYNNGFAASLVALLLVPLINAARSSK